MNIWESAEQKVNENGGYLSTDKLSNKGKLNETEKKVINDMGELIIYLRLNKAEKLWNQILREIDLSLRGVGE